MRNAASPLTATAPEGCRIRDTTSGEFLGYVHGLVNPCIRAEEKTADNKHAASDPNGNAYATINLSLGLTGNRPFVRDRRSGRYAGMI